MASSSSNVVGVHYRVGKKIGEGSFGVIFEGTNLLNNNQVAIKFVRLNYPSKAPYSLISPPGTTEKRCTAATRRISDIQDSSWLPYVMSAALGKPFFC